MTYTCIHDICISSLFVFNSTIFAHINTVILCKFKILYFHILLSFTFFAEIGLIESASKM